MLSRWLENVQRDRCLVNPPYADENNWGEIFREADGLLNQLVTSETCPRQWRRQLSEYARRTCKVWDSFEVEAANLAYMRL